MCMRLTRSTLSCLNISSSICAALHPYILTGQGEKNGFQETDRVIEDIIGKDRKGRLDSNLNVLSRDCHWYSYRLAGSSTICQITPLTISPAVKGKPSFHYVIRNISKKKMFPESPSPATQESISMAECHMGRLNECKFNHTFLQIMKKKKKK